MKTKEPDNIKREMKYEQKSDLKRNIYDENNKKDKINKELDEEKSKIKNKNIEKLNEAIFENDLPNKNDIIPTNLGEKIICIHFITKNSQEIINYSITCKNTDLFVKTEEKLYNDFPKFKDFVTYFEVNGKKIKRFRTIEENNIQDNDIISLILIEE